MLKFDSACVSGSYGKSSFHYHGFELVIAFLLSYISKSRLG